MARSGIPPDEPPAQRVVVFLDYQNVYNGARRAFGSEGDPAVFGQVHPMKLGYSLASRPVHGRPGPRTLSGVRIYRGRPDPRKEPGSYAAHMRQCQAWEAMGATVIPRQLRYPHDWPTSKAEEKGVDVHLAVDMIMMALRKELDVAILFSADTDLRPVLESYCDFPAEDAPKIEVAAWTSASARRQLSIPGHSVWCHRLDQAAFEPVRDRRDYNIGRRG